MPVLARHVGVLSSNAKCNTPADLISARLFKTLRSVAMRSYSHLSEDERDQIGVLRAGGRSMGAIARALGRAKTTISRELQRNALPSGGYSPLHAAGAYQLRRRREAILEREAALRLFVGDRLAEGSTPEQISGWLARGLFCGATRWPFRLAARRSGLRVSRFRGLPRSAAAPMRSFLDFRWRIRRLQ